MLSISEIRVPGHFRERTSAANSAPRRVRDSRLIGSWSRFLGKGQETKLPQVQYIQVRKNNLAVPLQRSRGETQPASMNTPVKTEWYAAIHRSQQEEAPAYERIVFKSLGTGLAFVQMGHHHHSKRTTAMGQKLSGFERGNEDKYLWIRHSST